MSTAQGKSFVQKSRCSEAAAAFPVWVSAEANSDINYIEEESIILRISASSFLRKQCFPGQTYLHPVRACATPMYSYCPCSRKTLQIPDNHRSQFPEKHGRFRPSPHGPSPVSHGRFLTNGNWKACLPRSRPQSGKFFTIH